MPAVVDLAGPRADGRLVVAAAGRLALLDPAGALTPFARGPGGYSTAQGPEPYIALSTGHPVPNANCSFPGDTVFAIEPSGPPRVIAVDPAGQARRFADLPPGTRPNGIVFDGVGRFGFRLLVTAAGRGFTVVSAIDCAGKVATIAGHAPEVEGGLAVAPSSFGRFGGELVAPDERSGRIWAIDAGGTARLIVHSGVPSGPDVGVESAGFVPGTFDSGWSAYVADRRSPGNPHPGTDSILALSGETLIAAGVRPGDLLVATEGGGQTVVIRCASACAVRRIAAALASSHVEGHIVLVPTIG